MPDSNFVGMIRANLNDPTEPFGLVTVVNVIDDVSGDKLEEILRELVSKSRRDSGNLIFEANRDLVDRTRFVFYDRWESLEAIAAHEQGEHFQASMTRMEKLFASPPTVSLVKLLE